MLLVIGAAMISLAGPGPGSVSVELRWHAPAGCPDREQMMMRMLVPPGDGVRDPVQVSATVQRHTVCDQDWSLPFANMAQIAGEILQ